MAYKKNDILLARHSEDLLIPDQNEKTQDLVCLLAR